MEALPLTATAKCFSKCTINNRSRNFAAFLIKGTHFKKTKTKNWFVKLINIKRTKIKKELQQWTPNRDHVFFPLHFTGYLLQNIFLSRSDYDRTHDQSWQEVHLEKSIKRKDRRLAAIQEDDPTRLDCMQFNQVVLQLRNHLNKKSVGQTEADGRNFSTSKSQQKVQKQDEKIVFYFDILHIAELLIIVQFSYSTATIIETPFTLNVMM